MPSSNHRRNLSWPPHIIVIDPEGREDDPLAQIDDSPFEYFISNSYDDDALAWSASILDPAPAKRQHKFSNSISKKWAKFVAKQEPELHEKYHANGTEDNEEYIWPEQDYKIDHLDWSPPHLRAQTLTHSPPLRGRSISTRPHAQLRRETRRLSGHRRSWAEPSPEISTVLEEPENGCNRTGEDPVERVDTPLIPEISLDEDVEVEDVEVKAEEKKIEKKVRFKLL